MSLINNNEEHLEENFIIEVYKQNFLSEMKIISKAVEEGFNVIGLDTEFPGIVYFPKFENEFKTFFSECIKNNTEIVRNYNYTTIKLNVDNLKLIQIGLTLYNPKTDKKKTWQFNVDYNIQKENYSDESIELLEKSGINFKNLCENGIEISLFAEYLIISGLVLNNEITWVTFHGNYDLAYLLKLLINQHLPENEEEFLKILKIYFPNFYDLKYLLQFTSFFEGGLNKISKILHVQRKGYQHQAGSDSLLTIEIFLKFKNNYFNEKKLESEKNNLWGMNELYDAPQILEHLLKNSTFYSYFYTNYYYQMANGNKNNSGLSYITERTLKTKCMK